MISPTPTAAFTSIMGWWCPHYIQYPRLKHPAPYDSSLPDASHIAQPHHIKSNSLWVPLWHSRLRIWHCHCNSSGQVTAVVLVWLLNWELPHSMGAAKKKKNPKWNRKTLYLFTNLSEFLFWFMEIPFTSFSKKEKISRLGHFLFLNPFIQVTKFDDSIQNVTQCVPHSFVPKSLHLFHLDLPPIKYIYL